MTPNRQEIDQMGTDTRSNPSSTRDGLTRRRAVSRPRPGRVNITLALAITDVVSCLVVLGLTMGVAGTLVAASGSVVGPVDATAVLAAALGVLGLSLAGAYDRTRARRRSALAEAGRIGLASAVASWALLVLTAIAGQAIDLSQLVLVSLLLPIPWFGARWLAESAVVRRKPEQALLIGTGSVARRLLAVAGRDRRHGFEVAGLLDDDPLPLWDGAPPVIGGLDDLEDVLADGGIDRVIVAFTPRSDAEILGILRRCDRWGVQVDVVPRLFDLMAEQCVAHSVGGLALVGIRSKRRGRAQLIAKRAIDVAISAFFLLVTLPLTVAIAALIRVSSPGPVLFRQIRVGRDGRLFEVMKFRTMRADPDVEGVASVARLADEGLIAVDDLGDIERLVDALKAQGESRVTTIGRLLRATSLDELPQLWNVLVGQMSIVGPRPLRPFEVSALDDWQHVRHDVRPGITGLWQVLGRSDISWNERIQLDYSYVRHWTVATDLKLMLRTIPAVLARKGAV